MPFYLDVLILLQKLISFKYIYTTTENQTITTTFKVLLKRFFQIILNNEITLLFLHKRLYKYYY